MSHSGGGHAGGHGAAACGFSHPDQSANWNMAFQSGDNSKPNMTTLKRAADPRLVIGGALVFFVGLMTLPYIMDAAQDDHYGKKAEEQTGDSAQSTDYSALDNSKDPQIRATKQMFDQARAQALREAFNVTGSSLFSTSAPMAGSAAEHPDMQFEAATGGAEAPSDGAESGAEPNSPAGQFFSAANEAGGPSAQGGDPSAGYTQDAVKNMVSASGLAPGRGRLVANEFGQYHQAQAPQAVAQPAPMPLYGGAMQSPTQPYMIFVPGQHGSAMVGYPPLNNAPAQNPQALAMGAGAAPYGQVPAIPQQPYAQAQGYGQAPAYAPYDHRSCFNPQTSAIVSPMGQRHHAPIVPMIPTGGSGGDYSGAGGRMRVLVNR